MIDKPWLVMGSPKVEWYFPEAAQSWPRFVHVSTGVTAVVGQPPCGRGHVVWGGELGRQSLVLAWDWAEIKPGVAVLVDPNMVLTNICFRQGDGQALDGLSAVVNATRIVHSLDWQGPVCALMDRVRAGGPVVGSGFGALLAEAPGAAGSRAAAALT